MATYTSNYAWTKPSGGDPVDIEVLNDNLDDQDSIVHQAFLDLAPVFSTANTYAVKDVVLYDNKVWICHTAVTTAGAWTGSTNWSQTTVGETGGVATYADLPDKPSINGNELSGNKTGAQLGLQNTLTFDNVPTANSTNPVKSGGVYSADEAIRQWTTASAKSVSGNPITLTDGSARKAEGLSVTCNPKQNLHGYDHPWAGGAGKNKLNASDITVANGYIFNDTSVNLSPGTYTFSVFVTGTPTVNTQINIMNRTGESSVLGYKAIREGRNTITFTTETAITSVASFTNTTNSVAISEIQIESGSSFTTFAPYSNECPITGLTECVVDDHGFNIWDGTIILGKVIKCTDGTEMADYGYDCTDFIPVIPNTPYYFNVYSAISAQLRGMAWYDENKNYISGVPAPNNTKYGLITSPSNAKYVRCSLEKQYEDNACINISDPSKDGTYEPYQSTTATITFGQTVYGGSVNFKTGKVTVTHKLVKGNTITWIDNSTASGQRFRSQNVISDAKISQDTDDELKCSKFATNEAAIHFYNYDGICIYSTGQMFVRSLTTTSLSDFETVIADADICYELATPTELTLTPAELELLKGYNYISTNGTTIALNYLPDSLLAEAENYVDAKIPPAPSSDGTYVLTCTVTSGTPAYSWESAT